MILQRFLNYFKSGKAGSTKHIPILWEDDYCQIELMPQENLAFVKQQIMELESFVEEHSTEFGYTDVFQRGINPVTTLSKEFRADYLKWTLSSFGLPELSHIQYEGAELRPLRNSRTKAFGFPCFTLFFETKDEFAAKIWLKFEPITIASEYEIILSSLYYLGEETNLLLVDWDALEVIDLTKKTQINSYLKGWRK